MPNVKKYVSPQERIRRNKEMKEKFIAVTGIVFFMIVLPLIVGLVEAL